MGTNRNIQLHEKFGVAGFAVAPIRSGSQPLRHSNG